GDVAGSPSRDHCGAYDGTAPIEVSSGPRKVYRLSRRGNRRLNHAIHMAAVTQVRYRHSQGRAYYDKKLAEGKTPKQALRALKRQVSHATLARLPAATPPVAATAAARRARGQGPGGPRGDRPWRQPARPTPRAPPLRPSPSQAWSPPYDRGRHPSPRPCTCPRRSWPFLDRCHSAVGDAAGP